MTSEVHHDRGSDEDFQLYLVDSRTIFFEVKRRIDVRARVEAGADRPEIDQVPGIYPRDSLDGERSVSGPDSKAWLQRQRNVEDSHFAASAIREGPGFAVAACLLPIARRVNRWA